MFSSFSCWSASHSPCIYSCVANYDEPRSSQSISNADVVMYSALSKSFVGEIGMSAYEPKRTSKLAPTTRRTSVQLAREGASRICSTQWSDRLFVRRSKRSVRWQSPRSFLSAQRVHQVARRSLFSQTQSRNRGKRSQIGAGRSCPHPVGSLSDYPFRNLQGAIVRHMKSASS
jgi:hypothetical protein